MKKIMLGLIAGVVLTTGVFVASAQWTAVSPNFQVFVRGEVFQSDLLQWLLKEGHTYPLGQWRKL